MPRPPTPPRRRVLDSAPPRGPQAEDFGMPVMGSVGGTSTESRWYVGEPQIVTEPVTLAETFWPCPVDGCRGEMVASGQTWETDPPSADLGYHHVCSVCGFAAAILNVRYPVTTYRRGSARVPTVRHER